MPRGKKPTCDLCCDTLDKGQDIPKCEGDCGCTVHSYCAGVTKRRYEELMKSTGGTGPYICEWCSLKTTHTIIQQIQCEVASLKQELAEAKALAAQEATVTLLRPTGEGELGKEPDLPKLGLGSRQLVTEIVIERVPVEGVRWVWTTVLPNQLKILSYDFPN